MITRDEAFALLKQYNKDPFHIQHSLTVEAVMQWYAKELGYGITVGKLGYSVSLAYKRYSEIVNSFRFGLDRLKLLDEYHKFEAYIS